MMYPESYKIEPSKRTPWIIMRPGKIFIMGRSIPDNPGNFYWPVHNWVLSYIQNCNIKTQVDFGFEYINTTSIKWIFTILRELSEMRNLSENAKVTWYYEQGDEDMCELGFILRSLVDCPFIVVEVKDMNIERYKKILNLLV
jgi:hypothetical protein